MLHLKYKLPLCKLEFEFKNQTGAKALATDHRVSCPFLKALRVSLRTPPEEVLKDQLSDVVQGARRALKTQEVLKWA